MEAITWDEALAERETRGRVSAAQEADLRAAQRRFGELPPAFQDRIRATEDVDRLYHILDQILDAKSIDEVDFS